MPLFAFLFIVALFSGCTNYGKIVAKPSCDYFDTDNTALFTIESKPVDLQKRIEKMAERLIDEDVCASNSAVMDPVYLDNYQVNSSFGYLIAAILKDKIVQRCHTFGQKGHIIELNKRDSILISRRSGTTLLSRDIKKLALQKGVALDYAIVGYYTYTPRRIFLTLELLDVQDGEIKSSTTSEIPLNCEMKKLLER